MPRRLRSEISIACSASRMKPTTGPCSPAGRAAISRADSKHFSASSKAAAASWGLSSTDCSISSLNSACKAASVSSALGKRARTSMVRCVSSSNLEEALNKRLRISANSAASASRASSAWPQEETISTSISRRCSGVSGMESSNRWRILNAFCKVVVEWFIARVKDRVRSGPNSAVARSSSSLPRRIDSSVLTNSS